jgi:hypothetical protein
MRVPDIPLLQEELKQAGKAGKHLMFGRKHMFHYIEEFTAR